MAPKSTSTKAPAKKVGESDVKSLAGLSFGTKDALPARVQTIDPERVKAATDFATRLIAGEVASNDEHYTTQHLAYLGAMVYRRLLVLGLARTGNTKGWTPSTRVVQDPKGFTWSVYAEAKKAKAAKAAPTS